MKVMLATKGPTMNSKIDDRFARAAYFLIYDDETQHLDVIDNSNQLSHGAGPQAVQIAIDNACCCLLSAIPGENAIKAIKSAGIEVYEAVGLNASEALEKLKSNQLKKL
ncbi:MAG TPA: dinitrogenase iron-molybdenum cofactor [Desulfurella acetivorans]|uniref:Dinitrogenase iron-molybdenum cofactor n=1 Tax=Desulfurella acetivorans TaxID=33002 RepID=A0A7C6A685_DESAE|nr:dinitrogenase iron-molybdenum cofactor [Desulfurella acetivorans]